jgi:flagellar basal-body rod protein FlgB
MGKVGTAFARGKSVAIKFDNVSAALEASLDLRLQRQALLTANLTNIDTPNYRPVDFKFQGFLTEAVDSAPTSKEAHEIMTMTEGVETLDGNGVDLDTELVKMSDNSTRYNVQLELMRRQFAILRYAAGMGSGA